MKCEFCGAEYHAADRECPNCVRIMRSQKWKIDFFDTVIGMAIVWVLPGFVLWALFHLIGLGNIWDRLAFEQ